MFEFFTRELFTRAEIKVKSKKTLASLFIFSFSFSILIFSFLVLPAVTHVIATEQVISGYHVSDIKCRTHKPQIIAIEQHSLTLDYSRCMKIKGFPQDLAVTIKVIPSYYSYSSFLTELRINESVVIGKDYSQFYFYSYLLIGLLWFLLGALMLFISLVYLKILLKNFK